MKGLVFAALSGIQAGMIVCHEFQFVRLIVTKLSFRDIAILHGKYFLKTQH